MKKFISGILTLALAVSMMTFTVSANTTSPVIASDILDASGFEADTLKIMDNPALANKGTGWNGAWVKYVNKVGSTETDMTTANNVIAKRTLSNDTGYYYSFASTAHYYYRGLANAIKANEDGIYYITFIMADGKGTGGANITAANFLFADKATVSIKQSEAKGNFYLMLDDTVGKQMDATTAYNFLVKVEVDADADDKISVEAVKLGNEFTGTWDLTSTKELGTDDIAYIGFSATAYSNACNFRDVVIEKYTAEAIASANALVAGASKNDFLTRIANLDTVLPNGVQKTLTKAAIKKEAGINAYDYLQFTDFTSGLNLNESGNEAYRNGGEGWRSGWTTGTSVSAATGSQGSRLLVTLGEKNYIKINAGSGFMRRWFNNISTAADGKYVIDCTLAMSANYKSSQGVYAGEVVNIGEGDSHMTERITYGIKGFPAELADDGETVLKAEGAYPFLTVGDVTVVGNKSVSYNESIPYKFSLEITTDSDGAEVFNLKVANNVYKYADNVANLTITDNTNFADTNLSYIELASVTLAPGLYSDFAIYEKKNILSIGYPRFYQGGAEVSKADLTDAPVTVKINVDNTTNTPVTGKLLMGAYSGAQMVGCAISQTPFSFAKGQSGIAELTYTPSEDVTLSSDNGLTVFMWNNLTPIVEKESIR